MLAYVPANAPLTVHGVQCSVVGGGYVKVVEVQKMLGFLRSGDPFPELLEVVVYVLRNKHNFSGPVDTTILKPEQCAPAPASCAQLRLRLTDCRLFAQPTEKAAEESESSTRAETGSEEPAAEPAAAEEAEEPAAEQPALLPTIPPVRLFGEKGFDVHMRGGTFARVLGDLYHAGQVMEKLDFQVQLELYKDSRKVGQRQVVDMIPKMVEDRRGGKAFDVDGTIARVSRVTMLVPAPTKINGFWGYWQDGRREIVSNFDELLKADNPPYGPETVFTVEGELLGTQGYDPSTQTVRTDDVSEVPLSEVHAIFADM